MAGLCLRGEVLFTINFWTIPPRRQETAGEAGPDRRCALKDIGNPAIQRNILLRIKKLSPKDEARWGKMTVHQMICHLNDGYRCVLAGNSLALMDMGIPRPMLKWIALRVPVRWPRGIPAPREIAQGLGGTPPVDFEQDRAQLVCSVNEFCARIPTPNVLHPLFGRMDRRDWMRWAYLHADHHLRQFGR